MITGLLVSQITDEMACNLLIDSNAVLESQRNLGNLHYTLLYGEIFDYIQVFISNYSNYLYFYIKTYVHVTGVHTIEIPYRIR